MITIVFDSTNARAGATLYLDSAEVQYQGSNVWLTFAAATSLFGKISGTGYEVVCKPTNSVYRAPGHAETIDGLDELGILDFALKAALGKYKNSEIFKGSTLCGHSPNAYSYIAMLLKQGMKDRFGEDGDVHSGVIAGWKKSNLVDYIHRVRNR